MRRKFFILRYRLCHVKKKKEKKNKSAANTLENSDINPMVGSFFHSQLLTTLCARICCICIKFRFGHTVNVWAHIMRQIKLFVTNQIYASNNRRLNIMAVSIRQTISVRGGDCSSHPLSTMIGNNLPWCRCCSCSIVSVAGRRCIVCARSPSIGMLFARHN